jgi:hypothetical protein
MGGTMSWLKRTLITLSVIFGLLSVASLAGMPLAYADASTDAAKQSACEAINGKIVGGKCETGGANLNDIIASAINLFSVVVGIVAVIMIIVGGFKYITSGGDSGNITSAKNTIVYAVIGIIIVVLAQVIVKFVLHHTV